MCRRRYRIGFCFTWYVGFLLCEWLHFHTKSTCNNAFTAYQLTFIAMLKHLVVSLGLLDYNKCIIYSLYIFSFRFCIIPDTHTTHTNSSNWRGRLLYQTDFSRKHSTKCWFLYYIISISIFGFDEQLGNGWPAKQVIHICVSAPEKLSMVCSNSMISLMGISNSFSQPQIFRKNMAMSAAT